MGYEEGLLAVAYRLLCALDYLHARGVAHRDLKPSNVLLAPTGHPYLLDFNLATHADDPWRLAGTLPYMAPEQLAMLADEQAAPPADWRPCDVFAFGVMLAELLAGKHPFGAGEAPAGAGQREVAAALLSAQRAGVPALPRHLPRAPREALGRCLRPDPAGRPTAAELVALFTPAAPRPRRRAALAALALVLPAALTAGWLLADRSDPAPSQVSLPTPEPPWPADPFERGAAYAGRGDFVSARIEFQKAAVAKKDGRAHACAAYCMARSGEHEAAVVELNLAIELGYRTAAVYANRAFSHSQRSRRDAALADCDAALRLDGHMRAARLTRAALLLQRQTRGGKLDPRAISDVRLGVSAGPNTANTWMTAAQIYALGSEGRPELRDAAAEAVAGAVRAGKSPAAIRENPVLRKALAGHPGFQAALLLPPGKADPALNPQLVNVVAEK
jgi:tetratricopeptide (TPR) repeat protein